MQLRSNCPTGDIADRWDKHRFDLSLVNPSNKRKFNIIVVGTGLAGASAAASLAELGYNVQAFCYQDSPRRAHSIAAQGGINAAKNYQNDGDSVFRLFYDTVKGGDFRSRESNVYRLSQVSVNIIDQAVAQGVPFAREYGGQLANRSFGGAQVSRTFYARGQTGQQLLLGAYSAFSKMCAAGKITQHNRHEMLDLIVEDNRAVGIVTRDLLSGKIEPFTADAVVLCSGGYGNVFYLSTNAKGCNVTASWRAHKRGAAFANPCYTQIHPTCIPPSGDYQSKLTLMSESLRNDGRVWVPKDPEDAGKDPRSIAEKDRDYYLERIYPAFGNLVPRDIASRSAKKMCDEGKGVGPFVGEVRRGVYLDFADAIKRDGKKRILEKYGNLFEMYQRITGDDPSETPMRIYPASHYTMGGLWVDYNLMSTIDGLFVLGEANFSDHGANRLGASALMQGLADGYFVISYTLGNFLAIHGNAKTSTASKLAKSTTKELEKQVQDLIELGQKGTTHPDVFHRELGALMYDKCGMARNEADLKEALEEIPLIRERFWEKVQILGSGRELNVLLEKAGRVADFLELAELMVHDALARDESCGAHYREEHVREDGEAKRDDENFTYVAAWEHTGDLSAPKLHKEELEFEYVKLSQRSYK